MTLLDQYIERALRRVENEDGNDFDPEAAREWVMALIEPGIKAGRLVTLAAYVLNGDIAHCHEGSCPDDGEVHTAPNYGCEDEGCVACLVQRDWLQEVLGSG